MMSRFRIYLVMIALLLFLPAGAFNSDPGKAESRDPPGPYVLLSSVVGSGGTPASDSAIWTCGTTGQPTPPGMGVSADDETLYAGFWGVFLRLGLLTAAETPEILQNMLLPNYPNPFNPMTTIQYAVAAPSRVSLSVFDVKGQKIRTLIREMQPAGVYEVVWDGRDDGGLQVASGVYFGHIIIGDYQSVQKMLMLK